MKILKNVGVGTELSKRFNLDAKIEKKCSCGHIMVYDLNRNYLSYPSVGIPENIYFYCDECNTDHKFPVKVTIRIDLEIEDYNV